MAKKGYLAQNDDDTYTIDTRVMLAEVKLVAGIGKGLCCHVTGDSVMVRNGGDIPIPQIDIASIDDNATLPIFGLVIEDGANGDIVKVVNNGLVTGVVNTSAWSVGDTLYLTINGVIDNTPPADFDGVIQIGTVAKVGILDGAIQLQIQHFAAVANFAGTLRNLLTNESDADNATTAFTAKNDQPYRVSYGITSSNNSLAENALFLFNEGHGIFTFLQNGDHPFVWYGDPTDSHDPANLTPMMQLTAGGILSMLNAGVGVDRFLDENDMASDSDEALATQQSIKAFASHDRQFVVDQLSHNTSSSTFTDIPHAIITAKDLSQAANYTVTFAFIVSPSQANTTASFRITLNGTPITAMGRFVVLKTNGADVGITFTGFIDGVVNADIIKVQWSTDKGTITLPEFNFVIDGIPESRVV